MDKKAELVHDLLRSLFNDKNEFNESSILTLNLLFPQFLLESISFYDKKAIQVYYPKTIEIQKHERSLISSSLIIIEDNHVDLNGWFCTCTNFKKRNRETRVKLKENGLEIANEAMMIGLRFGKYTILEKSEVISIRDLELNICQHLLCASILLYNEILMKKVDIKTVDTEEWLSLHLYLANKELLKERI